MHTYKMINYIGEGAKKLAKDVYNTGKDFYFNGGAVSNPSQPQAYGVWGGNNKAIQVAQPTSQPIQDASVSPNIIGNGGNAIG